METKLKKTGFTLIELLVVIVIIGILSTISTATFKSYFGKARDAERVAAVQNIALMMKVENADVWSDSKYLFGATTAGAFVTGLQDLFAENDFRVPKAGKMICYVITASNADVTAITGKTGDNNQFVISTWGETKSSDDGATAGIILDGTALIMGGVTGASTALLEADYRCANNAAVVTAAVAVLVEGSDGSAAVALSTAETTLSVYITSTGTVSETSS
ncbi:prepilin-type N-terminal cleavage/methylation domain-containing protein [Candidatus Gracilibacteria bacterium]|nr:prepilin-type N-terminal cleavage/methylation domain-containing protein [Candidatus Gracilibacteria bacterium]